MKLKKHFLLALIFITIAFNAHSQKSETHYSKAFIGPGMGIDYGGFGLKAEYMLTESLGIFGGGGYNLVDLTGNAGLSYKFLPGRDVRPVLVAMYGYNGVVKIQNNRSLSATYYGFTIGAGCDFKNNRSDNKWNFEILVPFREAGFQKHIDALKQIGYQFKTVPLPITFTIGYQIALGK